MLDTILTTYYTGTGTGLDRADRMVAAAEAADRGHAAPAVEAAVEALAAALEATDGEDVEAEEDALLAALDAHDALCERVKRCAETSEQQWEACLDSAREDHDPVREGEVESAVKDAEEMWTSAQRALDEGDLDEAEAWLRQAVGLAAEWGDDSPERSALDAVCEAMEEG